MILDKITSDNCDILSKEMYNSRAVTVYRWYFLEEDNYAFCTIVGNCPIATYQYSEMVKEFGFPTHYGMSEELRLRELAKQDQYSTLLILENKI